MVDKAFHLGGIPPHLDLLVQVQLHLVHQLALLDLDPPPLLRAPPHLGRLPLLGAPQLLLLLPPLLDHDLAHLPGDGSGGVKLRGSGA